MSRKERQFAKSQEWLAWLSDSPNTAPRRTPTISQQGYKAEQPRANSATQAHQERPGHSLGLRADMFATRASAHPQQAARAPRRSLRAPSQSARAVKSPQPTTSHEETIAIRIDLPKIHLPTVAIPWAKILRWGVPAIMLVALIFFTPTLLRMRANHQKQTAQSSTNSTPTFAPIKPNADNSAGVNNSFYDSNKHVYIFHDTYLGNKLTITEQSLPADLRTNKTQLATIAKKYINAEDKFTTVYGDVYISTNKDYGTQNMVLQHRQLLVFIFSTGKLNNDQWVTYIQNME